MLQSPYEKKSEKLKEKLLGVEKKYINFFEERNPRFPSDGKRDHLHNHWILWEEGYQVKFGFAEDSDLPNYIKVECYKVFDEVFNKDVI